MEEPIWRKMEELRLICSREIPIQQQMVNSAVVAYRESLKSIKLKADETAERQAKLGKLKAQLREVEDDLVKSMAVKNRKEAKRMATVDAISATKARVEEMKRIMQDQMARKEKYAALLSQQSHAMETLKERGDQEIKHKQDLEEAISWYNRVLGFRIGGGHGVRFIFIYINAKNPHEEYSFTVRHANDIYSLLDCHPFLDDTKDLVHELNQTNGLFKFVRVMREKFQAAKVTGFLLQPAAFHPDSSAISISAPIPSISADSTSESPTEKYEQQHLPQEHNRPAKKSNHRRVGYPATLSPGSASSLRRSPRFKVKK